MDAETSLVIAVCVLGTLVGVVVVVLAVLLLVHCCPNGRLTPRSWVARRNRRTRADMELEQLAAASGNFISDSMLPGNRTGASENLGIRSPDPRRVPALRVPDDLSPSPPFIQGQGQNIRPSKPRSRQPSPKQGHFLTVLNTIMPQGSQQGRGDDNDQNELSDTNFSSKGYRRRISEKGEYARIPSTSPKSRISCAVRPKTPKARGNVKGKDSYPDSEDSSEEDDDIDKCRDYGHSYYKPGGCSSYFPQNVFKEKYSRKNRSPRQESRCLYSRLPVHSNSLESPNRSNNREGSKGRQRGSPLNGSRRTIGTEGSQGRDQSRFLNRSRNEYLASTGATAHQACAHRQDRRDKSPPLASSSRNTSQDRSTSISIRQDNSHDEGRPRVMGSSNEVSGICGGVLPRRSRHVSNRHGDGNAGRNSNNLTNNNGQAGAETIQKPPRNTGHRSRQSPSLRGSRDRVLPETGSGGMPATPGDYIQAANGQLVPVSSLMLAGPSIQLVARDVSLGEGGSFREHSTTPSDARRTYVHTTRDASVMGATPGHASSTAMTLPSLTTVKFIDKSSNNNMEPSVLYHNSHHSSTQSLRPPSHLLGGSSSTFAGSHSIHFNMLQTPVAHSSHVVSLSDNEPNSPKRGIRFKQQGCIKQPERDRGAQGPLKTINKNGAKETTLSDTDEEERHKDRLAPDSVPPSPPASNTSSSSSPGTALSLAIQQCVPVSKEVITLTAPPTERPSFLDSRDLGDPTTASMSWDHLTPDPSPLFSGDTDLSTSQVTQYCRRKKRTLSGTGRADITLPNPTALVGLDLDDTFARNYELKPYKKLEIRSDPRVAANLNPAIDVEVAASETICEANEKGLPRKPQGDRGALQSINSDASVNCTSLGGTQGRQDVLVRPTNIINRFVLNEKISRDSVTSVRSDDSFSTPLLPSKNVPVANGSRSNVPFEYSTHLKKKIFPRGSEESPPGDPVIYSKLMHNNSLQSNAKR